MFYRSKVYMESYKGRRKDENKSVGYVPVLATLYCTNKQKFQWLKIVVLSQEQLSP